MELQYGSKKFTKVEAEILDGIDTFCSGNGKECNVFDQHEFSITFYMLNFIVCGSNGVGISSVFVLNACHKIAFPHCICLIAFSPLHCQS